MQQSKGNDGKDPRLFSHEASLISTGINP